MESVYQSPLEQWHQRSALRAFKYEEAIRDGLQDKLPFSPSLIPIIAHLPDDVNDRVRDHVLHRCLTNYMLFTTYLETVFINPAIMYLMFGGHTFLLDNRVYIDAMRVYCDEGYHALFSLEAFTQGTISLTAGIRQTAMPSAIRRIGQVIDGFTSGDKGIALISFAMVSETMVTGNLSSALRDESVADSVRAIIRAHAIDEAMHQAYFAKLYPVLWHQFSSQQRDELAPLFRKFAEIFVEPDWDFYIMILLESGCPEADKIVNSARSGFDLASSVLDATPVTRNVLKSVGLTTF